MFAQGDVSRQLSNDLNERSAHWPLVSSDSAAFPFNSEIEGVLHLSADNAVSSVFDEAWYTVVMDRDACVQLKKGGLSHFTGDKYT